MPLTSRRPTPRRAVAIVRAHRINVNDIPSLFSEGPESEPAPIARQAWLDVASLGQTVTLMLQRLAQLLVPQQARHEEPIGPASLRR